METNKLKRELSTRQLTMISLGSAIGTGLFLGSGLAIQTAGPSVLVSYAIGAFIVLLLMGALAEMTVAHPTSGSFGTIAERYVHPLAGFLVRYSYWVANVLAVGVEVSAIAIYMRYWFPDVNGFVWVALFGGLLIYVNARHVHTFGTTEYWLSFIKVTAIILFIVLGAATLFGEPESPIESITTGNEGFFAFGFYGMWVTIFISLFSFLGTELVAVTAGEAKDPDQAVPRALRATVFRLTFFYVVTLAIMLMLIPWQQAGIDQSPFVLVMEQFDVPFAAGILNFVILIAALSAMNAQLYASTRMMYSLAEAGDAPKAFKKISKNGIPMFALLVSTGGIVLAALLQVFMESSYPFLMGISMFGAIFTWFMVFVSHLFFRKKWTGRKLPVRMMGYPFLPLLGAVLLLSLMITTWFTDFNILLKFGVPWLIGLTIIYYVREQMRKKQDRPSDIEQAN